MLPYEIILHHVWKYRLFSALKLETTAHEVIQILNVGLHNLDAGPDFSNAKIRIGETIWAGNVEIHLKSSDWLKHQHQKNKAYDNVILHVVWIADVPIYRTDFTEIPTLELKDLVSPKIISNYDHLKVNNDWIPCAQQLNFVDDLTKRICLDRMLMDRLSDKSALIEQLHQSLKGSWEDTFYVMMAKSFGFKVNSLPFEQLAKSLPQLILAKHKDKKLQIEALFFGVSGLLERKNKDDYPNALKKEYQFLKAKYNLYNLEPQVWKFSKTRPDNFPTIRLAQFAALIIQSQHLFSKVVSIHDLKDFRAIFLDLPVNNYWENHFVFDKWVDKKSPGLGKNSIDSVLLNAIAPLLFFYGKQIGRDFYVNQSVKLLELIKPEQNNIVKGFKEIGFGAYNAFDTQALLQLKKTFCDHKNCLNCAIGIKILRT
jgi:hypothetical protein